jgi:hypothetical protein
MKKRRPIWRQTDASRRRLSSSCAAYLPRSSSNNDDDDDLIFEKIFQVHFWGYLKQRERD